MRTLKLITAFAIAANASAIQFVTPIGGTAFVDWSIVNYVDQDSTAGIADYTGGNYTYNGHDAIDFTLPNFAAMDRGISVYAAAAGTVIAVHDGEFDRYSRVNPNPGNVSANYIQIDHGNGIITSYWHLKKNSPTVLVGSTVTAGQQIGQVGSSGLSTDAHLHFGVTQNGTVVDTQLNPSAWWVSPIAYSGTFVGTLDRGVSKTQPTTADLVNRPTDSGLYTQQSGQQAWFWASTYGVNAGDALNFKFYNPSGSLYANYNNIASDANYGWWYAGTNLPNTPDQGLWTTEFYINGTLKTTSNFTVVPEAIHGYAAAAICATLLIRRRKTKA